MTTALRIILSSLKYPKHGIYIHNIKDSKGNTTTKGRNPFDDWTFKKGEQVVTYPTYDWVDDDGYKNMGDWIEKAAKAAGK